VQKLSDLLSYNPGSLPTRPAPNAGEHVQIEVEGLPPRKNLSRSIRNRNSGDNQSFAKLRAAATSMMNSRSWYSGPIDIELVLLGPHPPTGIALTRYLGGVCDTLGGSHGYTFTFLPIAYEDDCQIEKAVVKARESTYLGYRITVRFK
jgi:hypothetical protein